MRQRLCSELAAEFGSRVTLESTAPEVNGVICCRWSWWLEHQHQLPVPDQLIAAMLPIASLEEPLTAARVESLKRQGKDWFRTLLLPEALTKLIPAIAPLRQSGGRLAMLMDAFVDAAGGTGPARHGTLGTVAEIASGVSITSRLLLR